jgi:hypothetical protein
MISVHINARTAADSLICKHCKIVSLVEAGNPNEAAEKVSHRTQQPNNAALDEYVTRAGGQYEQKERSDSK